MSSLDEAQYGPFHIIFLGPHFTLSTCRFKLYFIYEKLPYIYIYFFFFVPVFQLSAPGIAFMCSVSYLYVIYPALLHASLLTCILFAQVPGTVFHVPFCAVSQGSSCCALVNVPFISDDFSFSSTSFRLISSAIAVLHIF